MPSDESTGRNLQSRRAPIAYLGFGLLLLGNTLLLNGDEFEYFAGIVMAAVLLLVGIAKLLLTPQHVPTADGS